MFSGQDDDYNASFSLPHYSLRKATLPHSFQLTQESKELFDLGREGSEDNPLSGQGYIGVIDLENGDIYLQPAFNRNDGKEKTDKNGKPFERFCVSSQPLGTMTGDLHLQLAGKLGLAHKGGSHGKLLGIGLWKGPHNTISELRNRSSSHNFGAIEYDPLFLCYFNIRHQEHPAHRLQLKREIPLRIFEKILPALYEGLEIPFPDDSTKIPISGEISSHATVEEEWMNNPFACIQSLISASLTTNESDNRILDNRLLGNIKDILNMANEEVRKKYVLHIVDAYYTLWTSTHDNLLLSSIKEIGLLDHLLKLAIENNDHTNLFSAAAHNCYHEFMTFLKNMDPPEFFLNHIHVLRPLYLKYGDDFKNDYKSNNLQLGFFLANITEPYIGQEIDLIEDSEISAEYSARVYRDLLRSYPDKKETIVKQINLRIHDIVDILKEEGSQTEFGERVVVWLKTFINKMKSHAAVIKDYNNLTILFDSSQKKIETNDWNIGSSHLVRDESSPPPSPRFFSPKQSQINDKSEPSKQQQNTARKLPDK